MWLYGRFINQEKNGDGEMNKLWVVVILILALIAYDQWRSSQSYDQGFNKCTADNVTVVNDAVAADRKTEKDKQDKVDAETKKQFDAQRRINDQLNDDLDKLRKRANRKQQPKGAELVCEGATGADLSSEDAGFLTREAARADTIRTALEGCYSYTDTVATQ